MGSAPAWLERRGRPQLADRLIQECRAGLVEVRRLGRLSSFNAPPTRRSGAIEAEYLARIADAFGIDPQQVILSLPEVQYAFHVAGNYDYILQVEVADLPAY